LARELTAIVAEAGTVWARLLIFIFFAPFKLSSFICENKDIKNKTRQQIKKIGEIRAQGPQKGCGLTLIFLQWLAAGRKIRYRFG
jgi:uncharacterized membrane protein